MELERPKLFGPHPSPDWSALTEDAPSPRPIGPQVHASVATRVFRVDKFFRTDGAHDSFRIVFNISWMAAVLALWTRDLAQWAAAVWRSLRRSGYVPSSAHPVGVKNQPCVIMSFILI